MPAKKPAPKAAKGKKAASRPPVHKPTVARKPAERVQAERFQASGAGDARSPQRRGCGRAEKGRSAPFNPHDGRNNRDAKGCRAGFRDARRPRAGCVGSDSLVPPACEPRSPIGR